MTSRPIKSKVNLLSCAVVSVCALAMNLFLGVLFTGESLRAIGDRSSLRSIERVTDPERLRAALMFTQMSLSDLSDALRWAGYLQGVNVAANIAALCLVFACWNRWSDSANGVE